MLWFIVGAIVGGVIVAIGGMLWFMWSFKDMFG